MPNCMHNHMNNIYSLFNPISPIQCTIKYLDEPNFTSLASTCKSADEVRKAFADPRSGFHRYYENRADEIRQSVCAEHISVLLRSLDEAYFTAPREVLSASVPVCFSIHQMLFRPGIWDQPVLESVYEQITAYEAKQSHRYSVSSDVFVKSTRALNVLKTQIQVMIQPRELTEEEMDAEFIAFEICHDIRDEHTQEIRERLDLGFDRGPMLCYDTMRLTLDCTTTRYTSVLWDVMVDLEKRVRRGVTNADISMTMELASVLGRRLERAIYHGYEDETLRTFNRAIDLVFPMETDWVVPHN